MCISEQSETYLILWAAFSLGNIPELQPVQPAPSVTNCYRISHVSKVHRSSEFLTLVHQGQTSEPLPWRSMPFYSQYCKTNHNYFSQKWTLQYLSYFACICIYLYCRISQLYLVSSFLALAHQIIIHTFNNTDQHHYVNIQYIPSASDAMISVF